MSDDERASVVAAIGAAARFANSGTPQAGDDIYLDNYGAWKIKTFSGRKMTLARSDGTELDIELQVN